MRRWSCAIKADGRAQCVRPGRLECTCVEKLLCVYSLLGTEEVLIYLLFLSFFFFCVYATLRPVQVRVEQFKVSLLFQHL